MMELHEENKLMREALTGIAEACNCCGGRADLSEMAAECLAVVGPVTPPARLEPVALEPEWIVNDLGELGVRVAGRHFFLYKGDNIEYLDGLHSDGTPMLCRNIGKREFGETVWPWAWIKQGHSEARYRAELVYTPGLSFGPPDAPKYTWRPLPPTNQTKGS